MSVDSVDLSDTSGGVSPPDKSGSERSLETGAGFYVASALSGSESQIAQNSNKQANLDLFELLLACILMTPIGKNYL